MSTKLNWTSKMKKLFTRFESKLMDKVQKQVSGFSVVGAKMDGTGNVQTIKTGNLFCAVNLNRKMTKCVFFK